MTVDVWRGLVLRMARALVQELRTRHHDQVDALQVVFIAMRMWEQAQARTRMDLRTIFMCVPCVCVSLSACLCVRVGAWTRGKVVRQRVSQPTCTLHGCMPRSR